MTGHLARAEGAAHRERRRQHRPGRAGRQPGPRHVRGPLARVSAVVAGSLTVSPASLGLKLSLSGLWTGTLTLTAHGGPVSAYHVAVPAPLLQELTLSQASGSLAAGQSVRIKVTAVGERPVLHGAADRQPGRPQRPGHLSATRLAGCAAARAPVATGNASCGYGKSGRLVHADSAGLNPKTPARP